MKTKCWLLMPLMAFTLAACGGGNKAATPAAPAETAVAQNNSHANMVRVAVEPVYPPFVQPLSQGGFEGFDIDVLSAIAEKGGFKVSFTPYPWVELFDRLNKDEVDIVAGGMTITEERRQKFDFSNQYATENVVLVVPQNSPIKSLHDVHNKRVAYQIDTYESNELQKIQGTHFDKDLGTESAWLSFKRVLDTDPKQKADAAIGASTAFEYYAKQYKDAGVSLIYDTQLPDKQTAFIVKKGNTELLSKLNKGLDMIKADGTLEKLRTKWMMNSHQHSASEPASH